MKVLATHISAGGRPPARRTVGTPPRANAGYAESMCDPSHYLPLAIAAEQSGWTSFTVPDSICYPEVSDSKYPYTPDGNREFLDGKPFIEPFTLIPAMAAVTERLRFTTFVVKLPIRLPVLVAKSGRLRRGDERQPLRLRGRAQPVARGLRRPAGRTGSRAASAWTR